VSGLTFGSETTKNLKRMDGLKRREGIPIGITLSNTQKTSNLKRGWNKHRCTKTRRNGSFTSAGRSALKGGKREEELRSVEVWRIIPREHGSRPGKRTVDGKQCRKRTILVRRKVDVVKGEGAKEGGW